MGRKRVIQKIIVAAPLYPPEIGGPATYVRMLEEELPQHGFEVVAVPFAYIRRYPKVVRHFVYLVLLLRASSAGDLVYALDPVSVGLPAWVVAVVLRKPFWVRLGGDYAWEQGVQRFGVKQTLDQYTKNKEATAAPVRALAALQGFVVRRALRVVVPSKYMASIVRTWSVQEDRLSVIYSALHSISVPLEREDYRKRLGLSGLVIVSAGRLVPWKGFFALIETLKQLQLSGLEATLFIAGDGPQKGVLHEKIAEENLSGSVHLLGKLSKKELGEYIKASDTFILNTAYEGLSHQLLEVMDLEVPIVTTGVGGNPELITDKETGLLVSYDNVEEIVAAIQLLVDNPERTKVMTKRAKVHTQHFTQEKLTKELVTLLKQ